MRRCLLVTPWMIRSGNPCHLKKALPDERREGPVSCRSPLEGPSQQVLGEHPSHQHLPCGECTTLESTTNGLASMLTHRPCPCNHRSFLFLTFQISARLKLIVSYYSSIAAGRDLICPTCVSAASRAKSRDKQVRVPASAADDAIPNQPQTCFFPFLGLYRDAGSMLDSLTPSPSRRPLPPIKENGPVHPVDVLGPYPYPAASRSTWLITAVDRVTTLLLRPVDAVTTPSRPGPIPQAGL